MARWQIVGSKPKGEAINYSVFKRHTPMRQSAQELAAKLPDPVPLTVVAEPFSVSESTVYHACHRFLAAKLRDDVPGMKSGVPCFRPAGRRRFVIPRDAFIRFYTAPK